MKGTYVKGSKEGEFTLYYNNGTIESTGRFESNSRSGVWKYFYSNGKPRQELEFTPVFGDEPTILFLNDPDGKRLLTNGTGDWFEVIDLPHGSSVTITGEYKDNEKHGKWEVKYHPGKNVIVEHFNKGRFINGYAKKDGIGFEIFEPQTYSHLLPDKFAMTEGFHARPMADFNMYPHLKYLLRGQEPVVNYIWDEGDPVYTKPDVSAKPPDSIDEMYRALVKLVEYPQEAQVLGVQGRVYVEFLVDRGGNLRRFKVVKGIGGGCDEEAVRVLEVYADKHRWTPAVNHGRVVKQLLLLSLAFEL
jgi:TonB family protein